MRRYFKRSYKNKLVTSRLESAPGVRRSLARCSHTRLYLKVYPVYCDPDPDPDPDAEAEVGLSVI